MATTHLQCVQAVADAIAALSTGFTVHQRKLWYDRQLALPAIIVSPVGVETVLDATNVADDVGYPVTVSFLWPSNQSLTVDGDFDAFLAARRAVRKAFHNQRLAITDGTVKICKVEPGPVIDPQSFETANTDASLLTVRVFTRELRS